ncbi:MAG: HAD-IIIA family hydrolase [Candidatus Melainabacteria bacterium]|nr:HAD-IIIA family hydrolase [Candidatus Melainabacteria bacterium]
MHRAVFLDRDGVLNYPVFNSATNEYEAPFEEKDFKFLPGVIESLRELLAMHYKLFLVSNQPDYAKGKTTLENLLSVHKKMHLILLKNNIHFAEYYYCYHHPHGIISAYSIKCTCRKPGNLFLMKAKEKYDIDMTCSWMIGDRDVDIFCGQASGVKTILIKLSESKSKVNKSKPDFIAGSLQEAAEIIKKLTIEN